MECGAGKLRFLTQSVCRCVADTLSQGQQGGSGDEDSDEDKEEGSDDNSSDEEEAPAPVSSKKATLAGKRRAAEPVTPTASAKKAKPAATPKSAAATPKPTSVGKEADGAKSFRFACALRLHTPSSCSTRLQDDGEDANSRAVHERDRESVCVCVCVVCVALAVYAAIDGRAAAGAFQRWSCLSCHC
jgi:hypothetical protein